MSTMAGPYTRPAVALLAVVLTVSGCSAGASKPKATVAGVQTFTEDPKPRHTTKYVTYDHTPPAGGMHWPPTAPVAPKLLGWLRCGVYDAPVPNEFAVHSEEHGAVWLTYLPGASQDDIAKLVELEVRQQYVIVSPYPGQPGRFMASTWGAQLSVDTADDARLKQFVDAYAGGGQGGEKGADRIHGSLPPEERAALVKANG
jgi:hypothetical protein